MDYRKDARNVCSSCGAAMADDALELDVEGHVVCSDCKAKRSIEANDALAKDARRNRTDRRTKIALAVLGLVFVVFVAAYTPVYLQNARRARLFDLRGRAMRIGLDASTLDRDPSEDQPCDDTAVRKKSTEEKKPWVVGSAMGAMSTFPPPPLDRMTGASLLAKHVLRTSMLPESSDETYDAAEQHLRRMVRIRYLVIINGYKRAATWDGHATIVDVVERQRTCWVRFELPLDASGSYEITALPLGAKKALEKITKAIVLED